MIGLLLVSIATTSVAAPVLPFVGKRQFNFMGGSGTELIIQIRKDGNTIIKSCGYNGCSIDYRGKFKSFIPDGNNGFYRITKSKAYWLDEFKELQYGCRGEDNDPCIEELYKLD